MAETPPLSPHVPIADDQGRPTPQFIQWWTQQRGVNDLIIPLTDTSEVSAVLDLIGDTPGALLTRGAGGWQMLVPGAAGTVLTAQAAGQPPAFAALPPPPPTPAFTALPDTPANYTGAAGMVATVNANEDGLEFATSSGGSSDFLGLTDTPADYTGQGGKVVSVKSSEDGLEFVTGGGGGGSLPPGGDAGQVLSKVTGADGDAAWVDPCCGLPPPLARYWRIRVWGGTTGNPFMRLGEVEFMDSDFNEITSGTPTSPRSVASRAFDHNTGTYWDSGSVSGSPDSAWVGKDFGSGNAVAVRGVRIYPVTSGGNSLSKFSLDYSDDGSTFTTLYLYEAPEPPIAPNAWYTVDLRTPIPPEIPDPSEEPNGLLSANNAGDAVEWRPLFKNNAGWRSPASTQWRYTILSNVGNSNTAMAELEMRETPDGPNLCVGGTASSSGMNAGSPNTFFNGATNAQAWIAGSSNVWTAYTFPTPVSINHLRVYSQVSQANGWPITFKLSYFDGSSWVDSFSGATGITGANQVRDVLNPSFTVAGAAVMPLLQGHARKSLVVAGDEQSAGWAMVAGWVGVTGKSASFTLSDSDMGQHLRCTSALTVTVPTSLTDWPVGCFATLMRVGGSVSVVAGSGVTINTVGHDLASAGSVATLMKVGADEWDLFGDLT